jgi:hypothetical protein
VDQRKFTRKLAGIDDCVNKDCPAVLGVTAHDVEVLTLIGNIPEVTVADLARERAGDRVTAEDGVLLIPLTLYAKIAHQPWCPVTVDVGVRDWVAAFGSVITDPVVLSALTSDERVNAGEGALLITHVEEGRWT